MVPKPNAASKNEKKPWPRRQTPRSPFIGTPLKTYPACVGYFVQWRWLGVDSGVGDVLVARWPRPFGEMLTFSVSTTEAALEEAAARAEKAEEELSLFSARNLVVRLSGFTIRFCHLQICCFDVSSLKQLRTGWWFGTCFIFPNIGKNHPNWLLLFRVVETTNQIKSGIVFQNDFLVWGQAAQQSNQRVVRCGQ